MAKSATRNPTEASTKRSSAPKDSPGVACPGCDKSVQPDWTNCPYCATSLQAGRELHGESGDGGGHEKGVGGAAAQPTWWKNEAGEWCLGNSCFIVRMPPGQQPIYETDPTECDVEVARAVLGSLVQGGGRTVVKVDHNDAA